MKRKIISILIVVTLLVIAVCFLVYSNQVMKSVLFSFSIWKNNLFPALFPFFVLSELLVQYGFVDFLGELCKKFMNKFFHLPGECAFVLAMSMVSGFPSGAKYTKELVQKKIITEEEGSRLITFTHFSNPLFIMGSIAITFLNNKTIGLLILLSHFLANFILGIIFRPKQKSKEKEHASIKKALYQIHKKRINNPLTFGQILSQTIINTLHTLFLMLGVVTFFLIITTLLQNILPFNSFEKTLLSGIFEMTQGVKFASVLPITLFQKGLLITSFLSFGGLSVHMQVISIISDTKIKYKYFLFSRILHAFLGILIFTIFYYYVV